MLTEKAALLHFIHWPFYKPEEMAVLCGPRTLHGDNNPMIKLPGYVFDNAEGDLFIGNGKFGSHPSHDRFDDDSNPQYILKVIVIPQQAG